MNIFLAKYGRSKSLKKFQYLKNVLLFFIIQRMYIFELTEYVLH